MARGGKREGAGRRAGSLTVRTRKVAEQAAATGQTPLEVMLENMRHFQRVAIDAEAILAKISIGELGGDGLPPDQQFKLLLAEVKKAAGFRQMAHQCASDAAPYMHPRLAATTVSGDPNNPLVVKGGDDGKRLAALALILAKGAVNADSDGVARKTNRRAR